MASTSFLRPLRSGCALVVDASPGAQKTEIVGVNEWRGTLQIKIAAEPREGAANEELVRFVAERLGVPKGAIKILKGQKSTHKVLLLPVSAEKAATLVERD
ncbi:MAG: DUF167 domain-containing protein [Thermoplasmatota archaeon]|nr:YggU family protein [Candidatus Thermoplasmatota archaeon]MBU1913651.1 YggU family protein [Candidatus Thermoplasmatota archaeon]